MKLANFVGVLVLPLVLAACGGGGGGGGGGNSIGNGANVNTFAYKLDGVLSGLAVGQTVRISDGSQTMSLATNGSFQFPNSINHSVNVTVASQPTDGSLCEISDAINNDNSTATFNTLPHRASSLQVNCSTFPAFAPVLPQVALGAPLSDSSVLANPQLVPIFYADTPNQNEHTTFLHDLINSSVWSVLAQYGVGAATLKPSIVLPTPAPTQITDTALRALITANAAVWAPANVPVPFLLIYLPPTTVHANYVCGTGYHSAVNIGARSIPFAFITGCDADVVAQHEIMEGSADPVPLTGYSKLANDVQIWQAMVNNSNAEIGDLCELKRFKVPSIPGSVIQPIWSNAAAAAGQNPCQPSESTSSAFFGGVPQLPISLLEASYHTKNQGVVVSPGSSVVVAVKVFSNIPLSTPIRLSARTTASFGNPTFINPVTYSFDKAYAHNGDTVNMTISSSAGAFPGVYSFAVYAEQAGLSFSFPGAVANSTSN